MTRAQARLLICKGCTEYSKFRVCKACMCFMPLKVRVSGAKCPKEKWGKI